MPTEDTASQPMDFAASIALYQMGTGHYLSRALYLAAKVGIADQLKDGPRHYRDVARATETDPASLNRVLRLLATAGVFEERDAGEFALTSIGRSLRSDVSGSMRAAVMLFAGVDIQDRWKDLEYCVRTGEPAFRKLSPHGDAFSSMSAEQAAIFDEAMATFAPVTAAAVVAAYDFSQFGKVVDVGGGNGALLIEILRANPKLHGTVFDMPRVVEKATPKIAAAGLTDRCDVAGGSFFESVPSGVDAHVIKHVIHDWNDEKAVAILKNCHRAARPGGKVLIVEGVYPPRVDESPDSRGAAWNDVNMLVCTGGRQRSEAEFRALYEAAGLRLSRIVRTMAPVSVIEGVRE
jgi:SAM-dependent methyltransferase